MCREAIYAAKRVESFFPCGSQAAGLTQVSLTRQMLGGQLRAGESGADSGDGHVR